MKFASIWAKVTGPKVKEISPSSPDFWPERGRPTTSSAVLAARGDVSAEELERTKKRGRFARSFSRPRRAQRERASSKPPERTNDPEHHAEKDLPEVPALPVLPLSLPRTELSLEESQPEDIGRPGTAITTEGLQALAIFELAAEPTTPDEIPETRENPLQRSRSKSLGPDNRPTLCKKPSWFRLGNSNKDKSLPPPPPPNCPLPPVPAGALPRATSVESQRATVHDDDSNMPRESTSTATKSTLNDDDSLLDRFPLPRLVHDIDDTPDSSIADMSDAGSLHQSTPPPRERESVTLRYRKVPAPISTTTSYGHKHKDSAIGTPKSPHTPTGIKRWTRQASGFEDETMPGLLDVRLEEWDGDNDDYAPKDSSNDQALAALEFGVLK